MRYCPDLVDLVSLLILAGVLSAQAFLPSRWGSCPGHPDHAVERHYSGAVAFAPLSGQSVAGR